MALELPVVLNREVPSGCPERAHKNDAGLDLCAAEHWIIEPTERATVDTGISIAVPAGHAGLILPRSGMAKDSGVTVLNAPGLIDPGYRGPVKVILVNLGFSTVHIVPGHRIAQLLIVPFTYCNPVLYWNLPEPDDDRGEGGFGSTGA